MSEIITKNIICNLKRAHPFIDKIEEVKCREYMKEYISRNNNNKKLKLKFNSKLFIKSLLSNLEYLCGTNLEISTKTIVTVNDKDEKKYETLKLEPFIDMNKDDYIMNEL